MNDNSQRAPQWQRLVATWFKSRFGGDENKWMKANHKALNHGNGYGPSTH